MTTRVVILGCGPSGQNAAKILAKDKNLEVTVITGCSFIEWPIAMSYVLARPDQHDKALAPNPKDFEVPGVNYTYSVVEKVDAKIKKVYLTGFKTVSYDMLILATGFNIPLLYPRPGQTLKERRAEVQDVGSRIKNAKSVAIGGGGPVGIEVAGDIKAAYPGMAVKLVVKDLLKQWPIDARQDAEKQLAAMGIEVVKTKSDAPVEPRLSPGTIILDGKVVDYDVYLPMFSQGPNTKCLEEADVLDGSGRLKVNAFLQSEVYPQIFAIGTGNTKDPWVGIPKLTAQWETVAANISARAADKPLKEHSEGEPGMVRQPVILIGHGANGYAIVDFSLFPAPLKVCCCNGYGGFPCCPPICCWPMVGPCACGYCCQGPSGPGMAKMLESMQFEFGKRSFDGIGKPEQQLME